jgi:hypothetical protein
MSAGGAGFVGGMLASGGDPDAALKSAAYGAVSGGAAGMGNAGEIVGSGVNGYIQGGSRGFARGLAAGTIPSDLGFTTAYRTNASANIGIGVVRDGMRGAIVGGKDGIVPGIVLGQSNNAIGHLIGLTAGHYKGFTDGMFVYEQAPGRGGITVGNVMTASPFVLDSPIWFAHERDHYENPFEKALGAVYPVAHGVDLALGKAGETMGMHCSGYVLEEHTQNYPYSSFRTCGE